MEAKKTIMDLLNTTAANQLAAIPEVRDRFLDIFLVMNGGDRPLAEAKYESEKFYFSKLLAENKNIGLCTKLSLYGVFLDVAANGLTFDPTYKHVYVIPFNVNVGTRDAPKWEKRASLMIGGSGELVIRVRQGQIKYADNPVLVYEGDFFKFGSKNNSVYLEHESTIPRKSEQIIACYIKLTRPDGSVDYKCLTTDEVEKFKEAGKKREDEKDSVAWTLGFPGMIQAKTVKHAFRSYPKVRLKGGGFTSLATVAIEPEIQEVPLDYGIDQTSGAVQDAEVVSTTKTPAPKEKITAPPPVDIDDDFTGPEDASKGVVITEEDDF